MPGFFYANFVFFYTIYMRENKMDKNFINGQ